MSPFSAQIISLISAGMLILAAAVPFAKRRWETSPIASKGISPAGFDNRDILIGIFLLLFFSLGPLCAFSSAVEKQASSPVETTLSTGKILAGVTVQAIAVSSIFIRLISSNIKPYVGWKHFISLKQIGLIVCAIALPTLCLLIMEATGFSSWIAQVTKSSILQESVKQLQSGSASIKITVAITAVFFAPFLEEISFRGYLYPLFKKFTNPIFACVITSLIFGISHMNLVMLLPLSLFGAFLVIVYERTKSIWAPIVTHMLFNLFTVINVLFFSTQSLS